MTPTPTPARFDLAALPTALVAANRLQRVIGGPAVLVKRDDFTGCGMSGNKARSLEFLIGDALAGDCDTVVTGGSPSSNFCPATAVAARMAALECELVFSGRPPVRPHANLAAAQACGARVRFTGRDDRDELDAVIERTAAELATQGRRPYPMPRGGATAVGAVGFALAFGELAGQLDAAGIVPEAIVVASGSGTTQAGLIAGCIGSGRHWRILGASVSRPPAEIRAQVFRLARSCATLLDLPAAGAGDVEIVDAIGPGFGVASQEGERARQLALETEGLILDPVYTAKAMAVVLGLVGRGVERPVVFWHTGGLVTAVQHLACHS